MSLNAAMFTISLCVLLLFPVLIPKEKPPITVVGDVGGRIAIIVVRAYRLIGLMEHIIVVFNTPNSWRKYIQHLG